MECLSDEHLLLINLPNEWLSKPWINDRNRILHSVNWRIVFMLSKQHRLIPAVFRTFGGGMPVEAYEKFRHEFLQWKARQEISYKTVSYLTELAEINGLHLLIHKGMAFADYIYQDPYFRYCADIDLLMKEPEMYAFDRILRKEGFIPQYFDRVNNSKQIIPYPLFKRNEHHEFCAYIGCREGQELNIELSRALHTLTSGEMDEFFKDTVSFKLAGFSGRAYTLFYAFLAICENTYNNSEYFNGVVAREGNLRDYIDLYVFLHRHGDKIKKDHVQAFSGTSKLLYEASVVLKNLAQIYGNCIPDNISGLLQKVDRPAGISDIQWRTPFIHRLFNQKDACDEFTYQMKDRYYSINETDKMQFIMAYPKEEVSKARTLDIKVDKYSFQIQLTPCYDEDYLYFQFLFGKTFVEYMRDFYVEVRVLHHDVTKRVLFSVAALFLEENRFLYKYYQTDSFIYSTTKYSLAKEFPAEEIRTQLEINNDGLTSTSVCFPRNTLHLDVEKGVRFQVFLFERMYKQHYFLLSGGDNELFHFIHMTFKRGETL